MDFAAKEVSKDHCSQRAGHIKAELQIGEGTTNAPGFCLVSIFTFEPDSIFLL